MTAPRLERVKCPSCKGHGEYTPGPAWENAVPCKRCEQSGYIGYLLTDSARKEIVEALTISMVWYTGNEEQRHLVNRAITILK